VKKTLTAIVSVAVVGGTYYLGTISEFEAELLPVEDAAAVHVTIRDSVVDGRWLYVKQAGKVVDSVWEERDTLYGGRKNRQIDLRDMSGDGSGEIAVGDTFWLYARHYVDADDTSYAFIFKYWPRVEYASPVKYLLMQRLRYEVFRRFRPLIDTAKIVGPTP
jgi:hypothetical protein